MIMSNTLPNQLHLLKRVQTATEVVANWRIKSK